ncbi:hypothetical protein GIY62_14835 [Burkholderia plantarii]|uniref:hypothetical protein n=1 Tax=Burkholderia plantarii TaxID=41899 RepID=UPI00272D6B2F|nr:hypothetical protein [Burkholderia plantarii]WLE58403.1 hypothetical protein GIY62_14835 [Burkholderia plantarii]
MNSIRGVSSLAALALLGACAHTPPAPAAAAQPEIRVIDTSCQWVRMLRPSCSDVIGDAFARQIIEHNQAGVEHGCWKKPAGAACPAK